MNRNNYKSQHLKQDEKNKDAWDPKWICCSQTTMYFVCECVYTHIHTYKYTHTHIWSRVSCSPSSISLCSQGWLWTIVPPASTFQVPVLQVYTWPIIPYQTPTLNYIVAQAYNPSTQKAEAGRLPQVQGQPGFKPAVFLLLPTHSAKMYLNTCT